MDPLPTVRDIVAGIDAGTLDPAQLVRDCIQRYDALEPGVAAWVALVGTVVLGKTVTTEFAGAAAGPTRNPHNAAPTPGGSSSGSAAAFALERPPQISLYRTTYWDQAEQPSRDVLEDAATALRDAGLQIGEAAPPPSHADLHALHRTIFQWDLVSGLAWERLAGQASIRAETRSMLTTAARIDVEAADQARTPAQRARDDVDLLFGSADVLLTPAATGEAPEGLIDDGNPVFNAPWTLLGLPCVTVPGGEGLPVGVQIVGRRGDDARTLAVAAVIESRLAASIGQYIRNTDG